jgi:hypothetical protein
LNELKIDFWVYKFWPQKNQIKNKKPRIDFRGFCIKKYRND